MLDKVKYLIKSNLTFALYSSSANDTQRKKQVAIKKFSRPFQSLIHAKRTYRELKLLRHMNHENVCCIIKFCS